MSFQWKRRFWTPPPPNTIPLKRCFCKLLLFNGLVLGNFWKNGNISNPMSFERLNSWTNNKFSTNNLNWRIIFQTLVPHFCNVIFWWLIMRKINLIMASSVGSIFGFTSLMFLIRVILSNTTVYHFRSGVGLRVDPS